jgi:hypothetical protein
MLPGAGREISREEGSNRLSAFFLRVENCARVSVDSLYRNTNMWYVEEGCGCFEVVVD